MVRQRETLAYPPPLFKPERARRGSERHERPHGWGARARASRLLARGDQGLAARASSSVAR
jgi:hypothetical protein